MKVFVARQPIFDRRKRVVAYELLFRSGMENMCQHPDPDQASSRVIDNSFTTFGMDWLTAGKRAFVNVTRRVLLDDVYSLLPKEKVVIELLETVGPDEDVLEACRGLKDRGYTLALDDFVFDPSYRPLVKLADIIKVDFRDQAPHERQAMTKELERSGVDLLAEKVENEEEYLEAIQLGYRYFQGYFFCRPVIVVGQDVPAFKMNYLRLIEEVNTEELDFDRLETLIKQDVGLSVKLLRYLNSAAFGWRHEIGSIRQAILLLGETAIKKWASLIALTGLGEDKPRELVVTSLIRAKFCESLAGRSDRPDRDPDPFLLGLLSLLDALMDRPIDQLLNEMPVSCGLLDAILGDDNAMSPVLDLVRAYERGAWDELTRIAQGLSVSELDVPDLYEEAVRWAGETLSA